MPVSARHKLTRFPENRLFSVVDTKTNTDTYSYDPDGGVSSLSWKALQYLNLYRLFLALIIVSLNILDVTPRPLGAHDMGMLKICAVIYLVYSLINVFTIHNQRPTFSIQLYFQVLADIIIITFMMHASGGAGSGLGALLVVAVAGGSLLAGGRTAAFFAAVAALAVLLDQIYTILEGGLPSTSYTQAGLLGATFFATALVGYTLARRMRDSEALAEKRGIDLANMSQLTEYIIQRMQTGVIVLDGDSHLRLINESARHLLGLRQGQHATLERLSPKLAVHLKRWRRDNNYLASMFRVAATGSSVLPRFAMLGDRGEPGTMIFIEDTAAMAQQAQQLKLASLGRLTASIAHEIRNPLSAISHAGQLLEEAEHMNPADRRLTEIIRAHARRVNTIIENIMQLSRRQQTHSEELNLSQWLYEFHQEFSHDNPGSADIIGMAVTNENINVHFDSSQLAQVVTNLCKNALRHCRESSAPRLMLLADTSNEGNRPFLDIMDNGPGVAPADINKLFEPFFTNTNDGTGLGLYIARELCESNQAQLDYLPREQGACFRITFADPRRHQVL
jgi:two-component system sensor histidine kinase PilS (NtrC family)